MLSDSIDAQNFNNKLRERYGIHVETLLPHFRIVFSDEQYEKQYGTHRIFSEGGIFLRGETGVRNAPKYGWLDGQWVIERLHPNNFQDVFEGAFTYEPLYAFKKGLPLNYDIMELVVKAALKIIPVDVPASVVPKTREQAQYNHNEKMSKESSDILNKLDGTAIQSALHDGGAVTVPNKVFNG